MAANKTNVTAYYADLNRAGENGEYDKALKIISKIIVEVPDDPKVLQCKAVSHIHLSEFEEAFQVLQSYPNDCHFEQAYCLYRLNRIQEAYDLLNKVPNPSWKVKELIAQILYRLERYEESFEMYKDLIKNSDDDFEEERETNLAAVVANLYIEKGKDFKKAPQLRLHTYELCYNEACSLIAKNEYDAAIEKLKHSEELCKKTLEENDATEEEIESELAVIRVQLGYAFQMQKKTERAMKTYNQVLKKKPSDSAIVAVASNNIITINKDQNVFDSKKKIKAVTSENLEPKMTSKQRQAIALNHCLLLLNTNQMDHCKKLVEQLPESSDAALMHAAILCKEKKVQKAVDILKRYAVAHPEQSNVLSLTLTQLLLSQGHISQACDTLRLMGELSYTPGIVSALVTLYSSLEDKDSSISLLEEAIAWHKKKNPRDPALVVLIQEIAKVELKNGHPNEAAEWLEDVRKNNPGDLKSLAQLITAYSKFNPQKAKEVSKQLPPLSEISTNADVDSLESTSWTMGAKYVKKGGKTDVPPLVVPESGDAVVQKRKKKRKKGKLPKNYDPNVDPDPERWLPRWERSTYKKKKDKRSAGVGKGTQGAIATGDENAKPIPGPSPSGGTPNSQSVQPPRQQKGQKKKKKGRW